MLRFDITLAPESCPRPVPRRIISRAHSPLLSLLSEVTGESRPYHGKEAVDPRQGRARGGEPTHLHAVNVAQPVRFSSKLQTCPLGPCALRAPAVPGSPGATRLWEGCVS